MAGNGPAADHCRSCRAPVGAQARFCPMCGAARDPAAGPVEMRKGVVIVFADLVGSTTLGEQLDPELLQAILDRYFTSCSACITEHGGMVEKFIGDAIMAVFGVPRSYEDDALRALRAAAGLLTAVARLSQELDVSHGVRLDVRIGICAGEAVVSWFVNGDFRVIGDAVNTASRLQSAAAPGRALVCGRAAALVRNQAHLEPAGRLAVKGKKDPVPAWHLISAGEPDQAAGRGEPAAFVGRQAELAALTRCHQDAVRQRRCSLVTVLGDPGIGKSRLVGEFLRQAGAGRLITVSGHCRAYGQGATFRPVIEVLDSFAGGRMTARDVLSGLPRGEQAWQCLDALDRRAAEPAAGGADVEEISWAAGTLLAAAARRSPLVVIWDDLHWAEPTLLDLIEKCSCWLTDAPALMICLARPDFAEQRPSWGAGWASAVQLELGPLSVPETAELVGLLAGGEVIAQEQADDLTRVIDASEGNPLFAELMLDIVTDEHGQEIAPGISALLGARLDQLPADERGLAERAATIGRYFTREQLDVLRDQPGPDRPELSEPLQRLIRRRFLERDPASGTYRFTHAMIRDTAYAMTPKSRREGWHLRIADWYAGRPGAGAGRGADGDILAYHLEAAALIGGRLRPADPQTAALARRAARAVIDQGALALGRRDLPAAAGLLERGRDLLPAGEAEHARLALRVSDCWLGLGQPDRAVAALDRATGLAAPGPQPGLEIQRLLVAVAAGRVAPPAAATAARVLAGTLSPGAGYEPGGTPGPGPGHELARCRLAYLDALLGVAAERLADAEQALATALPGSRAIGDGYEEERLLSGLCELALWGRTPTSAGLARCAEMTARFAANHPLLVPTRLTEAALLALAGRAEQADAGLGRVLRDIEEMKLTLSAAIATQVTGLVHVLAGRFAAAEADFRRGAADLVLAGQDQGAATLRAYAARAVFEQGQIAAAAALTAAIPAAALAEDLRTRLVTGALRARLASAAGRHDQAAELAAATAALAGQTDDLWLRGDVRWDQARVLAAAGQPAAADRAAAAARDLYVAKEADLLAGRVTRWRRELGALPVAEPDGGTGLDDVTEQP